MTKSPPARGGLTRPDDRRPEGWVTATHCPPLGGGWSYLLRGWQGAGLQDSFLFSWGGVLIPRGRGEECRGDGVEGRREVSKKEGKAALCPSLRAVSLCVGGGGNRRSCGPLG